MARFRVQADIFVTEDTGEEARARVSQLLNYADVSSYDIEDVEEVEDENAEPTEPDEDDITTEDHVTFYQSGRKVLYRMSPASDVWRYWHGAGKGERLLAVDCATCKGTGTVYKHGSDLVCGTCDGGKQRSFGDDHKAALRAYMDRVQFWPNVWWISDHGNAHLIDLTEGK